MGATKPLLWALAATKALALTTNAVLDLDNSLLDYTMRMRVSWEGNFNLFDVVPLTTQAGLNVSADDRRSDQYTSQGPFILANLENYDDVGNGSVAYTLCGSNESSEILDSLVQKELEAIVLFNLDGSACKISETTDVPSSLIYSMTSQDDSERAMRISQGADAPTAIITGNATQNTGSDNSRPVRGTTSGVAMSILYSITALISLLFIVIISTGAIRAHRHPERYGPREGAGGRPRQSRAKGLARAVLETLPIVKFGDNQQQNTVKDPERDHELQAIPEDREPQTDKSGPPPALTMTPPGNQVALEDAPASDQPSAPVALNEDAHISGATASAPPADRGDDGLGCSICTEDFLLGQDVRVLPCGHKFHPECVDPWLMNVSGTCPLCRYDLRPPAPEEEAQSPTSEEPPLAPPLENDGAPVPHQRRMSRFFDVNVLRHAPREERIQALRRYRSEHNETQVSVGSSPSNEEERSSRAAMADRLRERFRVRTTRRGRSPNPLPQQQEGPPGTRT